MRKKIQNTLKITCNDVDLTTVTNIEFYVRQTNFFATYTPTVISANEMVVIIPFKDAKRLCEDKVELQFAFMDENENPMASETVTVTVKKFLKESGYDPISNRK